jgi:hypothetical protein
MGSFRTMSSEAAREHREKYRAVQTEVLDLLDGWYECRALHLLDNLGPCTKQVLLDLDVLSARLSSGTVVESILSDLHDQYEQLSAEFSDDQLKNLVQDCAREFDQEHKEYLLDDLVKNWGVNFNGDLYVRELK